MRQFRVACRVVVLAEGFTGMNPQETIVHRLRATLAQMPQLEGEARK